jgi:hypothetical protein
MRYFITPNYCIPLNAKCGSSSLCRRIIATYYPDIEEMLQKAHYPKNLNADKIQPHRFLPETSHPDRPVAMMVREPLERFLSGVAYLNIDLDMAVDSLINGTYVMASRRGPNSRGIRVSNNVHFAPQADMPYGETHLFKFPTHLQDMAELIGVNFIPHLNITPSPKPTPTESQKLIVLDYYSADTALYDSIVHPDFIFTAPKNNTIS